MGLSIWQILIIVAVILLLFGGRKIPGLMRDLGSGITQFRKGLKADSESAAAGGDARVVDGKSAQSAGAKVDEVEKA